MGRVLGIRIISNGVRNDPVHYTQRENPAIFDTPNFRNTFLTLLHMAVFPRRQGSTLRKKLTSPAGLVTVMFTSPEIFLLALILIKFYFK